MDNKTYLELSSEEILERKRLTPKEQSAVDDLMAAVKALPKSLCISVEDFWDEDPDEPNFKVSKRITRGSATQVASLRKKSLTF